MATYSETINFLLDYLYKSMPEYVGVIKHTDDIKDKRRALRDLMNLKKPGLLPESFLDKQNALLKYELSKKRLITLSDITASSISKIGLVSGDITKIIADAIVNPASQTLLGCFVPGHYCVDNDIHSAAGLQLRNECAQIIKLQNHEETPGHAKVTKGYNLPCKFVIHTVAPRFKNRPSNLEVSQFKNCYISSLEAARLRGLKTICFPAIGVGEMGFSSKNGATIAINTVEEYLNMYEDAPIVIFCMKYQKDFEAYEDILG